MEERTRALRPLEGQPLSRLLDIGCGFGGLTRFVAEHLGIGEAHGIDYDSAALQEALAELDVAQDENDQLYARWAELTDKAV